MFPWSQNVEKTRFCGTLFLVAQVGQGAMDVPLAGGSATIARRQSTSLRSVEGHGEKFFISLYIVSKFQSW